MKVKVFDSSQQLGISAADTAARIIGAAIAKRGRARIVLSTGASQFDTLEALLKQPVQWEKVEMFHLDEYVGLAEDHPASFVGYLRERFVRHIPLGRAVLIDGTGDPTEVIRDVAAQLTEAPVDLGLIGIGENAHIAFNDPPANFETREAYITVELDDRCKMQQVREGWFPDIDSVPKRAITMTPHQIMQCGVILSCVPYKVKARAVAETLASPVTNTIPATLLKNHPDATLFLDGDSASEVPAAVLESFR